MDGNGCKIKTEGLPLSDVLDQWMTKNAYKGNYHLQGTVGNSMIFDDIHIPLKDQATKQNYNSNKFALLFFQYLKTIGINPKKEIKSNTIYITIL